MSGFWGRAWGQVLYAVCMLLDHRPHASKEQKTRCVRCGRRIERLGGSWW